MWELVGNGTLIAMLLYAVMALATGHLLGGPAQDNRITLGLCTVSRHPGVALAVATANFPNQILLLPAVLLLTAVGSLATWPYVRWMSRAR
jgi:BASS family bile acid:Na+ symporter